MAKSKRWCKAMVASFVIHAFVLTGVGWVASRSIASQQVTEQYIELDLSREEAAELPLLDMVESSKSGGGSSSSIMPQATAMTAASSASAVPQVIAATNNLAILSTEVPATAGQSIRGDAGKSNGVSDQGQGNGGSSGSGRTGTGNGGVSSESGGYTHPTILAQVMPTYPDSARRQGIEGTVVLKIQILSSGRPGFVSVYRSSGSEGLDAAAVKAVQQWRFNAAEDKETGEAVTCTTTLPVVFKLD